MFDFQQKNKLRRFLYSPVTVGMMVIIAIYTLYSTWSVYGKLVQSKKDMEKSQGQLLALVAKNTELDSDISELQTSQGVEKEIRSKFGVAKPDESMAVIVSDSDFSTTASSTETSFWTKFTQFFGF